MVEVKLNFPTSFSGIEYPKENCCYSGDSESSRKLFKSLLESSNYRCMYCGTDLSGETTHKIDGNFEKEHTTEKVQEETEIKYLKECKFNFSVTCSKCNKLKKEIIFIDKRHLKESYYEDVCKLKKCTGKCFTYYAALINYVVLNSIIAQPTGVNISRAHKLEYNFFEKKFMANEKINHSEKELIFIEKHIKKFELNSRNLKILSQILTELYIDIREGKKIRKLSKQGFGTDNNYNNVMDDIFIDYLETLTEKKKRMIITYLYNKYNNMNK